MSSRTQLLEILDNSAHEAAFEVFLKRTYCVENLLFYRRALQYEAIGEESERKAAAAEICKMFIGDSSTEQINVEGQIVTDIMSNLEKAEANLFAKAKSAAFKNMWNDSLAKFTDSPEWAAVSGQPVEPVTPRQKELKKDKETAPSPSKKRARADLESKDEPALEATHSQPRREPLKKRLRNYQPRLESPAKAIGQTLDFIATNTRNVVDSPRLKRVRRDEKAENNENQQPNTNTNAVVAKLELDPFDDTVVDAPFRPVPIVAQPLAPLEDAMDVQSHKVNSRETLVRTIKVAKRPSQMRKEKK